MSKGLDLKNPCCVNQTDDPNDPWLGSVGGKPGELAEFSDPAFSYRAALRNIMCSIEKGKVDLLQILSTYAPVDDGNDPLEYANTVTNILRDSGYNIGNHFLDVGRFVTYENFFLHANAMDLLRAIARVECGERYEDICHGDERIYGVEMYERDFSAQADRICALRQPNDK